jgi:predicted O-linked N-acetylglucosamine transferase (SPINDLY family)
MKTFTESRDKYNEKSVQMATRFQEERDYKTLAKEFVKETGFFLEQKYKAVQTFERARKHFEVNNLRETRLHLENMPRLFAKPSNIFEYFLWLGVAHFYENSNVSAYRYFNKAAKLKETLQLCVNLILTSEKLGNTDDLLYWCERSLKHKFDLQIVHKIVNLVQKRSYFERSKWGNYLLSLWKDDINNVDWTSIFMAQGNMLVGDCCLTMHHEEGIKQIADIITRGLAFADLHKVDLTAPSSTRTSLEKLFSNLFLHLNYYETNNKEHFRYVQYFMKNLPPLKQTRPPPLFSKIPSNRKMRVAFLSGDLIYHPVSYILNGIVEHFDKSRFDVVLFSTTEKKLENSIQNSIRKNSTEFVDLHGESVDSIVDAIKARDIDLLIEMSGHTTTGTDQLSVIRQKPARVIAQYFAYPNTYGIPEVDYKIGDKHVFPTGLDQYYTENFCMIKGGLHTYKAIADITVNRIPHEGIIFGCTNNPKKYRPNWIKCVANILKRVPNSKLKCRYYFINDPSVQEVYYKEFEKHGIDRHRIDLGLGATLDKYFAAYSDMDICLDPFPYNGGTINIEILYASLPYITLLGNSYVSRVGASILHQVGHPELIAKNEEAYVEYAVALANDKERLDNYKATLRADMMKSTLGDNKAFTREFERGCEWMLREKGWFGANTNKLSYA